MQKDALNYWKEDVLFNYPTLIALLLCFILLILFLIYLYYLYKTRKTSTSYTPEYIKNFLLMYNYFVSLNMCWLNEYFNIKTIKQSDEVRILKNVFNNVESFKNETRLQYEIIDACLTSIKEQDPELRLINYYLTYYNINPLTHADLNTIAMLLLAVCVLILLISYTYVRKKKFFEIDAKLQINDMFFVVGFTVFLILFTLDFGNYCNEFFVGLTSDGVVRINYLYNVFYTFSQLILVTHSIEFFYYTLYIKQLDVNIKRDYKVLIYLGSVSALLPYDPIIFYLPPL